MGAVTDFASMTSQQKVVWSRTVWSAARDMMFVKRFIGTSTNSMIQRITELTPTERGDQVLFQLVADLVEDGVISDNQREGHEEQMASYAQIIQIDLISHQVKNKGKLANQKTVINFREQARDKLAYWLADRVDQLVFLTLSGVSYAYNNNGSPRIAGSPFPSLSFASDVAAHTAARALRWSATSGLNASDTTQVASADVASYQMIVDVMTFAKDHYIRPLMADGKEYYVMLVKPGTMGQLKKDPDYLRAVTQALPRTKDNPFFTGATVTVDGAVIQEHRKVYSTVGAASGSKWGSGGTVDGTRTLLCGAQALGMADIMPPDWVEKFFDYDTKQGISVDKMFGLLAPQFYSIYDQAVETFGSIAIDHALPGFNIL